MSHYFTNDNLESNEKEIKVRVRGEDYTFITDNGVFSKKGLDFGTRTLLESLPDIRGKVLDLGCGYGPVGIVLAKNCIVDMADINKRSVALAIRNAKINNRKVNAFVSNIYENITEKYDYIVTNPPIRAGKQILYEFLFKAGDYLKDDGQLWLVIHKDQGAKSTFKELAKVYETKLINKNKGFYIIMCKKR